MEYQRVPKETFQQHPLKNAENYDHQKYQTARIAQEQIRGCFLFGSKKTQAVKQWWRDVKHCLALVEAGDIKADKAIDELVKLTNLIKSHHYG